MVVQQEGLVTATLDSLGGGCGEHGITSYHINLFHAPVLDIADQKLDSTSALKFIVQRIRALTQADGAAIALETNGRMLCVATSGVAPDVGAAVDRLSGLSGECVRAGALVVCRDTGSGRRCHPLPQPN